MTAFLSWAVFPLMLGAISIGCGLLVAQAAGRRLPSLLILPVGFALSLVAAGFTTILAATAEFTTPLVVGLAALGYGGAWPLGWRRFDFSALLLGAATYAAYLAPVALSGSTTFAGYIKLDDTASWLGIADQIFERGRDLSSLPPSSYDAMLDYYVDGGYPVATYIPTGFGHTLLGVDGAWLFQPYEAFLAAVLGLSLAALIYGVVKSTMLRTIAAFVGAQAAVLYGYTLWGGVKEVAAAALLALIAALVPVFVREPGDVRATLPLAVAGATVLHILGVGGVVWLGVTLLLGLAVAAVVHGRNLLKIVRQVAVFAAAISVLAVPAILAALTFLKPENSGFLTKQSELGNLAGPLSRLQLFGIWPVGDFRSKPEDMHPTYVLVAVVVAFGLVGAYFAWRRRAWGLLVYVGGATLGCLLLFPAGSPWVDGKAIATASAAFVTLGLTGAAVLVERGKRVEGVLALGAIVVGVAWSNLLAYHEVWLAPGDQLHELESVGKKFAGQGPTLMTEYQAYGVRHFLRDAAPEGAQELRRRPILLRNGQEVPKGGYADIDAFGLDGLLIYRTLVLRRSPVGSRPPSVYQLVRRGRYYEVWQRPDPSPAILEHLSLGIELAPASEAPCTEIQRLAALPGVIRLAAVRRPSAIVVDFPTSYPSSPGRLSASVKIPREGTYGVWLGGSFRPRVTILVDGHRVAESRHHLNALGQFTPFSTVRLAPGTHEIAVDYAKPDLRPGTGGPPPFGSGPLVLSRTTAALPVTFVDPAQASTLCGRTLDWVEALSSR